MKVMPLRSFCKMTSLEYIIKSKIIKFNKKLGQKTFIPLRQPLWETDL